MFQLEPNLRCLDLAAPRVLRLQRSVVDVEVALPGHPPQKAQAYVFAFFAEKGVRVAIALHCLWSSRLAFYLNAAGEIGQQDCALVFADAVAFAESMGFQMAETDLHLMESADRTIYWDGLPLKAGVVPAVIATEEADLEVEEPEIVDADEVVEELEIVEAGEEEPAPAQFAEVKPVEVKPVEVKPVEVKPVEVKPVEVKPVEVKPVEVKPVEVKPVEVKPVQQTMEALGRLLASF